jgi:hypothetical protein
MDFLAAAGGWGKAPTFEPLEGDPLDLAALEGAAEEFRAKIRRPAGERSRIPDWASGGG